MALQMNLTFTRDSLLLWLGVLGALVAYISAAGDPRLWGFDEWMQFSSATVGVLIGKLQNSPLPSLREKIVADVGKAHEALRASNEQRDEDAKDEGK